MWSRTHRVYESRQEYLTVLQLDELRVLERSVVLTRLCGLVNPGDASGGGVDLERRRTRLASTGEDSLLRRDDSKMEHMQKR